MKEAITDEEGSIQDEEVVSQCLDDDDRQEEDDASVCSLSGAKYSNEVIKNKQCMVLDGSKCIDAKRCMEKSCVQKQCDDELTIQNLRNFCSFQNNTAQHFDGFSEFKSPHSFSIICRSPSWFHNPLNLSTSRFLLDSIKTRRRTRSTTDLGNFIVEYASADGPKSIIINPYGKWIIDAKEGSDKRSIMRQSLLQSLGDLESNVGLSKAIPDNSGGAKSPLLKSLSNRPFDSSSEKSRSEAMPLTKRRPSLMSSDEMFKSCSSSISSHSSAGTTISKGLLHFIWKGGVPYFVFMIDDERGEIFVANPWKVSSSNDKTLDYMYSFHSCGCRQKKMGRFSRSTSNLVGKMKVSSSLGFNSNRSRFMETEFVLFGATEDHAWDTQNSPNLKNMGLSKKMTDIFRMNYSSKHNSGPRKASQDKIEEFLPCLNELDMFDKLERLNVLKECLAPNLELAAIIIKDDQHEHSKENKETVGGGWGLKFLKKVSINHPGASMGMPFSSTSCQECSVVEEVSSSRSINVLVPAGLHGGPSTNVVMGPSSLTERWKSGGHCDCGGWDIGCPLTVLNDRSFDVGTYSSQECSQEENKSFSLFTQGTRQGEAALRMVNMRGGLYLVYFQSSLSVLQSFSIGVAIIHSQTPAICENCKYCT